MYPILALTYVREQIRRGAVQLGDDAVAFRLDLRRDWVKDARRRMRACGVLKPVKRATPPIFRVASVHAPRKAFNEAMTPRLRQLGALVFIATDAQADVVFRLASELPEPPDFTTFPTEGDTLIPALRLSRDRGCASNSKVKPCDPPALHDDAKDWP